MSLSSRSVLTEVIAYYYSMPRIWSETIAAHRDAVRDATLDATAALVAEHGLTGVTMSQIARESGIGRATLYKYFPDIESILAAWHERHIAAHLDHLAEVSEAARPGDRLKAVLREYATLSRRHDNGSDLAALLHQGGHMSRVHAHLHEFITTLVLEAAGRGEARDDIPAGELAAYCLHALTAASGLSSEAALGRLINVTLTGMRACPGNTKA
jgi:AcrR family transcriptional regulator